MNKHLYCLLITFTIPRLCLCDCLLGYFTVAWWLLYCAVPLAFLRIQDPWETFPVILAPAWWAQAKARKLVKGIWFHQRIPPDKKNCLWADLNVKVSQCACNMQNGPGPFSYTVKNSCGLKCSSTETYFVETGFSKVIPFHGGVLSCEAIAVIYKMCK